MGLIGLPRAVIDTYLPVLGAMSALSASFNGSINLLDRYLNYDGIDGCEVSTKALVVRLATKGSSS